MIEFYSFDEAREAWGKLHSGLRKHGMESTVIDTLISYFAATPTPPTLSEDLREALPKDWQYWLIDGARILRSNGTETYASKIEAVANAVAALAQVKAS